MGGRRIAPIKTPPGPRVLGVSLLLTLLLAASAAAAPPSAQEAANAALEAVEKGDDATLRKLAGLTNPDAWDVAVILSRLGHPAVANRLARASSAPDLEALPRYLATIEGNGFPHAAFDLRQKLTGYVSAGSWQAVIDHAGKIEKLADPFHRAVGSLFLAMAHGRLKQAEKSLDAYAASAEAALEVGALALATTSLRGGARAARTARHFDRTLDFYQRLADLYVRRGETRAAARARSNLGGAYHYMGAYTAAANAYEAAVADFERAGETRSLGRALYNLGEAYRARGEVAAAISVLERSLEARRDPKVGDRAGEARTLHVLGEIYVRLGDRPRAREMLSRALEVLPQDGPPSLRMGIIATMGSLEAREGRYEAAAARYKEALGTPIAEKSRWLAERVRVALGFALSRQGKLTEAESVLRAAFRALEELNDPPGAAYALHELAETRREQGALDDALSLVADANRRATELEHPLLLVHTLETRARTHLARKSFDEGLRAARAGADVARRIVTGLAVRQSASAREYLSDIYAVGVLLSAAAGDEASFAAFAEDGRAGALLESLESREALRSAAIPETLRRRLAAARTAEALARHAYRESPGSGKVDLVARRALRQALTRRREGVSQAIEAVQRDAKARAGADLLYPRSATLAELQAGLADKDVLVLYSVPNANEPHILALVVERKEARIVDLGAAAPIRALLEQFDPEEPGTEAGPLLDRLKRTVLTPLKLPASARRVLISPHAFLFAVPFSTWLGDVDLAYVPSGTMYLRLKEHAARRGDGVLALAGPSYGSGRRLPALPGSAKEAEAVADTVYLGKAASETTLRKALRERGGKRLRALHIGAHGRVDSLRPLQSSLELADHPDDDGRLTALEVFQLEIPADLVVASACQSGVGKFYEGEGLVGFTRAFMFAGTGRVMVSQWRVDDEATQALMIKFYELWNPKKGKGIGAARALRKAQAFVRSHEKWKHPYYWAGWVLWGLPD